MLEGWKGSTGRLEGEGWKAGGGAKAKLPDVLKLGGPKPLLLDLVQMICLSCLNVRVFKNRRRNFEKAVQVTKDEQHYQYELQRLATRKLLESAMRNDYGMVHLLLASNNGLHAESLVNARDCHGFTPLQYAARHGNTLMLELLLKQGANVLGVDNMELG